jgi:nickel superoxide dismutase
MFDLMSELSSGPEKDTLDYHNSITRYITVKEEHAELCKREVRVIFGDYFKKEHVEKYPELPTLFHKIMQWGSKSRQTTDRSAALELLTAVNRFAEIYWETKGIPTKRVTAPYKPSEEIVYPIL